MLALPIYFRGQTYYLHTRVAGRQFKRSLKKTWVVELLKVAVSVQHGARGTSAAGAIDAPGSDCARKCRAGAASALAS